MMLKKRRIFLRRLLKKLRILRGFLKLMLRKPCILCGFLRRLLKKLCILRGFLRLMLRKPCILYGFLRPMPLAAQPSIWSSKAQSRAPPKIDTFLFKNSFKN